MAEAIAETISISAVPSESASVIRTLLHANLFRVFAERDPLSRLQAIKETYAEDIVWFESPNNVIRGQEALNARAAELLDGAPGWKFKAQSEMTTVGNMGVLKWGFGPEDEVKVQGIDVVIAEAGKVKVLWTGLEGA